MAVISTICSIWTGIVCGYLPIQFLKWAAYNGGLNLHSLLHCFRGRGKLVARPQGWRHTQNNEAALNGFRSVLLLLNHIVLKRRWANFWWGEPSQETSWKTSSHRRRRRRMIAFWLTTLWARFLPSFSSPQMLALEFEFVERVSKYLREKILINMQIMSSTERETGTGP